jgi:hypothetical protein
MGTLGTLHWLVLFVLIPVLLAFMKKGASRRARLAGMLLAFLFSWIGYLAFYLFASKQEKMTA